MSRRIWQEERKEWAEKALCCLLDSLDEYAKDPDAFQAEVVEYWARVLVALEGRGYAP